MFSKKKKPLEPFTALKCHSCGMESKRKFQDGDVLFAESSECGACKQKMTISKIFGEPTE